MTSALMSASNSATACTGPLQSERTIRNVVHFAPAISIVRAMRSTSFRKATRSLGSSRAATVVPPAAWRTTAGCLIGLVLFLVVVPGCRFGFERNASLLRHWVDSMVTPFVVQGTVTSDHLNQSLPGVVFRLITRSPSSHDGQGLAVSEQPSS